MPRLYIQEYTKTLAGKTVCIACREGILRDHLGDIITDVKFLNRQGLVTTLFHNIPNRFANQKFLSGLGDRLPATELIRVPPETDFYSHVLDHPAEMFKLIFLERKCLVDHRGERVNTLTTSGFRDRIDTWGELIANANFKGALERICSRIEKGLLDRVHILPAGRHTIRYELFSIEGTGTLIANNFTEAFQPVASAGDVRIVEGILSLYRHQGYLKPRTRAYLDAHRDHFFVTLIDGIVVGCVEEKPIDDATVEMGALAISSKFRHQRIATFMIQAFVDTMAQKGISRVISLTRNPDLESLYRSMGFEAGDRTLFAWRQDQSPGVTLFHKTIR